MGSSDVERQSLAAAQFARALAGDDDASFVQAYIAAINLADGLADREDADRGAGLARAVAERAVVGEYGLGGATRSASLTRPARASGLHTDRTLIENTMHVIEADTRIVGGRETEDFDDCVSIGSANDWCCTGTLVAPNVVVTAGHCGPLQCLFRIFVGRDVERAEDGRVVRVSHATMHPEYQPGREPYHDLMVLILDEDIHGVRPRAFAPPDGLEGEAAVRLVGYGATDVTGEAGYGRRREVDVPLAADDPKYGHRTDTEFAAGRALLEKDSCKGDSGGPAYVERDGSWYVIGATSRAIPGRRTCGDGGIYTRLPAYIDWIRSLDGGHWPA